MPPDQTNSIHKSGNKMADDDEEEENEDGGVWFYVNKGGFPINSFTWERMYKHMMKLNPDAKKTIKKIQNSHTLPDVAVPQAPVTFPPNTLVQDRLEIAQKYMSDLQYNHTGTQFFEIRKNRSISGLMDAAKEMIKESLPIKCLEAVILGLYLTLGTPALDRFPISFKTTFNGNTYRHVVLGVYSLGKYGALGMSRRDDLMYKPLIYKSLSELLTDFKKSYEKYWHVVKKIKIGVPVSHDLHSMEHVNWKQLSLSVPKLSSEEMSRELDRYAREMRTQQRPVTTAGSSPHPLRKSFHTMPKSGGNEPKQGSGKSKKAEKTKKSVLEDKAKSPEITKSTKAAIDIKDTVSVNKPEKLNTGGYQLRI